MENLNSVCFIGRVEQLNKIEGADRIEQAIISNWECVIPINKYKIGDLVVIATNDAIIPIEMAESLGVLSYLKHRKKAGVYTVKTTKLKGVYSQAMIVSEIPQQDKAKEGTDMMDFFGIFKYEEPAELITLSNGRKIKYHKNPNFSVYYKFPNAKNVPEMFTEEDDVVCTRKIHGTNARYGIVKKNKLSIWDRVKRFFGNKWVEWEYAYGSHNMEKGSDSNGFYSTDVWKEIADNHNFKDRLWNYAKAIGKESLGNGIILYGEIYGKGIQKYYDYNRENLAIAFFDIELNGKYVDREFFELILNNLFLPSVDVLYRGKFNKELIPTFFTNIENSKIPHEGIVVSSVTGDRNKICKYINPAYLEFQSKKEDSTDFH